MSAGLGDRDPGQEGGVAVGAVHGGGPGVSGVVGAQPPGGQSRRVAQEPQEQRPDHELGAQVVDLDARVVGAGRERDE